MKRIILSSITAEGFGGKTEYRESILVKDNPESMLRAQIEFALKYGVELRLVKMEVI